METAIVAVIIGVGTLASREIGKVMKYKKNKQSIKKNLLKAFKNKNKYKIKKYILYTKDFDKRNNTMKLDKYLNKVINIDKKLNEENVLSLSEDFTMIDRLYENKQVLQNRIENKLDAKLDMLEKKRQETILRNNQNQQRLRLKHKKMNKGKKGKKSAMG